MGFVHSDKQQVSRCVQYTHVGHKARSGELFWRDIDKPVLAAACIRFDTRSQLGTPEKARHVRVFRGGRQFGNLSTSNTSAKVKQQW